MLVPVVFISRSLPGLSVLMPTLPFDEMRSLSPKLPADIVEKIRFPSSVPFVTSVLLAVIPEYSVTSSLPFLPLNCKNAKVSLSAGLELL